MPIIVTRVSHKGRQWALQRGVAQTYLYHSLCSYRRIDDVSNHTDEWWYYRHHKFRLFIMTYPDPIAEHLVKRSDKALKAGFNSHFIAARVDTKVIR